jgi:hypothetical protein
MVDFVSSQGELESKAAQAKNYGEATADRAEGIKDKLVGKVTGDKAQEASGAYPSRRPHLFPC